MTEQEKPQHPWFNDAVHRRSMLFVAVVLSLAAFVRVCACLNDFWFDEIWSCVVFAREVDKIWTQHDNNHYLNTLIIYLIGWDQHWYFFRIPAVAAGVGTIVLAWMIARRWGTVEGNVALLMTSTSFFLIQYSSEARGYAYVLLFVAASIELIYRGLESDRLWIDVAIGLVAVLGFLSHLTYIYCFASLMIWSTWSLIAQRRTVTEVAIRTCRWYLAPSLFLIWFYVTQLRDLEIGGADPTANFVVVLQTFSLLVGGPAQGSFYIFLALGVAVAILWALLVVGKQDLALGVFLFSGILLLPTVVLMVREPDFLFPRYFLVCIFMTQLLFSYVAGRAWQTKFGNLAVVFCLVVYVVGNSFHTAQLLTVGRGQYQAAVSYMDENSKTPLVMVGSASPVSDREFLLVTYYRRKNPPSRRIEFLRPELTPPGGTHWLMTHRFDHNFTPPPIYRDRFGNIYHFEKSFPYAGLSGWHCLLYRNDHLD